MKTHIAVLLALVLSLVLIACDSKPTTAPADPAATPADPAVKPTEDNKKVEEAKPAAADDKKADEAKPAEPDPGDDKADDAAADTEKGEEKADAADADKKEGDDKAGEDAGDKGPEVVNFEAPKSKKGGVVFKHAEHQKLKIECVTCHHLAKGDKAEEVKPAECKSCHGKDKKAPESKKAYHKLCKDCHKKGLDGKKGPTKCEKCHTEKK